MDKKQRNDDLKIRVSGLSTGDHEYHLTAGPDTLGLAENFTHPVLVDVQLTKNPRQIFLKADVSTTAHFQCDRCLEEFDRKVETSYKMVYLTDEGEAVKYPEEEVQVITPDTPSIDLTDDVRQMITFAVPMKLLCREECKGLCPHCGANLNERDCSCPKDAADPRWDSLQKIMKQ